MKSKQKHRLAPGKLTKPLPEKWLRWKTTEELEPSLEIVGQERAMRAIEVGLKISTRGFNIFAVGEAGAGKTSTLQRLLAERSVNEPVLSDICYVTNFRVRDRPQPLLLQAG